MASIFRKDDHHVDKPNRNSFDMSFQNNLTTKFGVLKPVYCQEVLPGDTFKIKPTFALRFLPQVFPVQTRMRAHLHFFYVRNRTLWKDWEDFITKTKDGLIPPYLSFNSSNRDMLKVGGICDSFGVPVVSYSDVAQSYNYTYEKAVANNYNYYYDLDSGVRSTTKFVGYAFPDKSTVFDDLGHPARELGLAYTSHSYSLGAYFMPFNGTEGVSLKWSSSNLTSLGYRLSSNTATNLSFLFSSKDGYRLVDVVVPAGSGTGWKNFQVSKLISYYVNPLDMATDTAVDELGDLIGVFTNTTSNITFAFDVLPSSMPNGMRLENVPLNESFPYACQGQSENAKSIKISALPFRAYEAIYNSFYRNVENNPFMVNGVPEYNKYNRTYEGGADTNNYEMFNRNWEDDFLTTALPSPLQGNAPLVGITNRGDAPYVVTLSDEDGNLSKVKFSYVDGQVHVVSDGEDVDNVAGQLNEYLMESTNVGISIQDFRNVNSFQRWLENNVKGFKYRDRMRGHYGVSLRYDMLDMPEFIGGVSRDVSVQQVTQTVETEDGALGDFAGQSYVYGDGDNISHFSDEHGYIIGILSIVPMSNYSQMMPKHLMKRDALDYYYPEFGKIGMQPILNKEVCTLESISKGVQNDVFGYQRAWYDYVARVDEVHGLFTTDFRGFLIGRTFKNVPQLSSQFSTIQNDQLNNIFYVDDDADKILGQIYFNATGIRPIPVYGIPSLE